MRVSYIPPSSKHFDGVFGSPDSRGGGLGDIRIYKPNYHPRGGSIFGFLMRTALPFVRRIIAPELGSFVKNVASDVQNKTPLRQSLKKNLITATKNMGRRILRGGKRKKQTKKKNIKKKTITKKKNKKRGRVGSHCGKDIFSNNRYEF